MDAEKRDAIAQLQRRFPRLTVTQARAVLERHNWSLRPSIGEVEATTAGQVQDSETYFVGGGDYGSAQQVVAPTSGTNVSGNSPQINTIIERLFKQAERSSTEEAMESTRPQAFYGPGRRLGHTENPSHFISSTLRQRRNLALSIYRNGILVSGELFIPLDSPEGKEFIEAMDQGYIPPSLAAQYPNSDINVTLEDHLEVDYKAPAYTAFQGEGHRLTVQKAPAATSGANPIFDTSRAFHFESGEDASFIRLLNTRGERKEFQVNSSRHTVEDIYYLAHTFQPELEQFVLVVRDIPPRKLESQTRTQTIEEAKLKRAVIAIQAL